jgi:thioredoxin-related protein
MIKKLIFLLIILSIGIAIPQNNNVFKEISFFEAQTLSRQEHKPLLLKFHAEYCNSCVEMDSKTFIDPNVKNVLKGYIPLTIDIDSSFGKKLAKKFVVSAIPTIVILNDLDEEIYHKIGFQSPKSFIAGLLALDNNTNSGMKISTAKLDELIFVYNAKSGFINSVIDYTHKIVSPKTYNCNLCYLTYDNLGKIKKWNNFIQSLGIPVHFKYLDNIEGFDINKNYSFPAVFTGGKKLLINSQEINDCKSIDELIDLVKNKIDNEI